MNQPTPVMGDMGAFGTSPGPGQFTPRIMTPGRTPNGALTPSRVFPAASPMPHDGLTPYNEVMFNNDPAHAMSPILPINSQPMSPSMSSNINSTNNMMQNGSEMRYSPISPHYQNSPNRGYSPSSNRHYNGISPSYSYNASSSPNYSPNSSGSPSISGQNSGSSLHTPNSPYGGFKQQYNPKSPAYNMGTNQLVRRGNFSDESGDEAT